MTDQLKPMLIRHEGRRNLMYSDSRGIPTVGVGHNLRQPISDAAIDQILSDDIAIAQAACAQEFSWFAALDPVRQDVLIDMCFNMGVEGLKTFHMTLACIETGNYEGAAQNMLLSKWHDQVGQRAVELAEMMRAGVYPGG